MQFDSILSESLNHLNYLINNFDIITALFKNLNSQFSEDSLLPIGLGQDTGSTTTTSIEYSPNPKGNINFYDSDSDSDTDIPVFVNAEDAAVKHHVGKLTKQTPLTTREFLRAKANYLNSGMVPNYQKRGFLSFIVQNNIDYYSEIVRSDCPNAMIKADAQKHLDFFKNQL